MAATELPEVVGRNRNRGSRATGPYVLRPLLENVPLSAEGDRDDIEINCVEFLGR